RFWNQVLVSAVNEDVSRMAAAHAFQVFWLGFLARSNSYEMGIPAVPLGELYSAGKWERVPNVRVHLRAPVERIAVQGACVRGAVIQGDEKTADFYVSA